MPNPVPQEDVERALKSVFSDHSIGAELRFRNAVTDNGDVLVYFDGHDNDHDGPFAAKIPHPRTVGDEIWRSHDDTDSLSEWCTYAVLVPILEEYLTGRAEGRGTRDGKYWWLDLSD